MLNTDCYSKMMFGENAIRIPIRMIVQNHGKGVVSFIGAVKNEELRFGSKTSHQFILGDAVIRPHLVMATKHLEGTGLAGIVTSSSFYDIGEWVNQGTVILDPLNIVKEKKYLLSEQKMADMPIVNQNFGE